MEMLFFCRLLEENLKLYLEMTVMRMCVFFYEIALKLTCFVYTYKRWKEIIYRNHEINCPSHTNILQKVRF